jgi:hypothetical protein
MRFLAVCENEGLSIAELSRATNAIPHTVLNTMMRLAVAGEGESSLIEYRGNKYIDANRKRLFLSAEGVALHNAIKEII